MREKSLRVHYRLTCAAEESAEAKTRQIALEQTVELPEGCVDPEIEERIVGTIEKLEPREASAWDAVIAYDPLTAGDDTLQLLNLLFGNISLKSGIKVTRIDWPAEVLDHLGGPRHGIDGLRRLCGNTRGRPLLCAALKPMGLSPDELAEICGRFVAGGVDIIKDDHGLTDQETAPFEARLERCQAAVLKANRETGGKSLYFPNMTCGPERLAPRLELVREAGCRGIMISPLLVGPETVRWISRTTGLAILAHPALSGAYFHPEHGLAPEVLLGELFRIIGSDGVIYPNSGGRFPLSEETCVAINDRLRRPLGALQPSIPVPGGGIDARRVPHWIERYGVDTMFLIGGSLYAQPDLTEATRRLIRALAASAV
jgi:ribulose-bisphosphate carboxylase large chain